MQRDNDNTDDVRILGYNPLIPPQILMEELPISSEVKNFIKNSRTEALNILRRQDDRILVVIGPCSLHDPQSAIDYGQRLKEILPRFSDSLFIVMRAYFEKPRTTVGWKGLINDPDINGSFKINKGLRMARGLLCQLTEMGIPVGCELLDTITPQFIGDLVSWGAIGARTTESQLHRELASGCSFPVGFKNGTNGNIDVAVEGIISASVPHVFIGVTKHGLAAITKTLGNGDCHVILRGGKQGPNYDKPSIQTAKESMLKKKLTPNIMIDCSHDNSRKVYTNQPSVCKSIAEQIAEGETSICGIMIESHIHSGRQDVVPGVPLKYGVSITDGCVSFEESVPMLEMLAEAVRKRRALSSQNL